VAAEVDQAVCERVRREASTLPAAAPATRLGVVPRAAWPVAAGLAAGLAADAVLADPRRGHPVAGFGALAGALEQRAHRDSRAAGAAYALVLTAGAGALGAAADRALPGPRSRVAVTALATWAVVGGTTLRREAAAMARHLAADDLEAARGRIGHLCGRDPASLDAAGLTRATVESVAENTSDAVIGPLVWGAVGGMPGLLAYRAVNTLDAMVGHRSLRYERFGWAAARADDLANLLPARLCAALTTVCAPVVAGRPAQALRVWRRDGGKHPSPNAGPVEAAFAGALGRTLGGRVSYAGRVEDRPLLGDGPAPDLGDIARTARLSAAVTLGAGALAVVLRLLLDRARP
jgi:adenosylcobinamide-phosphate synthase